MKIGILETGLLPQELEDKYVPYPEMFATLLDGHDFHFDTYRVVEDVFPKGPEVADGWLITGSKHGVYEDHAWLPPLEQLIRDIYAREIPLIGVCFGHQVIAQALGGTVGKFDAGWAIGPQTYNFPDGARTINAWHQDQVLVPPEGAACIAGNAFCRYAALLYPGRAYTVQGHPEYGDEFIEDLMETRGKGVVPDDLMTSARAQMGGALDRAWVGTQFARFFKERQLA